MSLEVKLRFAAGITMVVLLISILLSGKSESVDGLMALIQVKVFHELRQVSLTASLVHLEKNQVIFDWALFAICMLFSLNLIYFPSEKVLIRYFIQYTQWFILWVCMILDVKSADNLAQYLLHVFWIHVAILYTVTQPVIIHLNITNGGIFWFLFPCSLVICNDTAAFICGRLLGKRKLLNLSPKKTLEGFVGACFITLIYGHQVSYWLSRIDSLIVHQSNMHIYDHIQYHGVILALYASLAAPFGGYFASALKRAGKIKDFGNWIPGHGGLADRVDCQLFMALFTFVYFKYIT